MSKSIKPPVPPVATLRKAWPEAVLWCPRVWERVFCHTSSQSSSVPDTGRVEGLVAIGSLKGNPGVLFVSTARKTKRSLFVPLVAAKIQGNQSMQGFHTLVSPPGDFTHVFLSEDRSFQDALDLASTGASTQEVN